MQMCKLIYANMVNHYRNKMPSSRKSNNSKLDSKLDSIKLHWHIPNEVEQVP